MQSAPPVPQLRAPAPGNPSSQPRPRPRPCGAERWRRSQGETLSEVRTAASTQQVRETRTEPSSATATTRRRILILMSRCCPWQASRKPSGYVRRVRAIVTRIGLHSCARASRCQSPSRFANIDLLGFGERRLVRCMLMMMTMMAMAPESWDTTKNMGYVRMYAYVPMLRVRGVASGI